MKTGAQEVKICHIDELTIELTPVQISEIDGVLCDEVVWSVGVSCVPVGLSIVVYWLCHSIVEQTHPHSTREHHREPRQGWELRLVIIFTQLEGTIFAEV